MNRARLTTAAETVGLVLVVYAAYDLFSRGVAAGVLGAALIAVGFINEGT